MQLQQKIRNKITQHKNNTTARQNNKLNNHATTPHQKCPIAHSKQQERSNSAPHQRLPTESFPASTPRGALLISLSLQKRKKNSERAPRSVSATRDKFPALHPEIYRRRHTFECFGDKAFFFFFFLR